MKTGQRLPRFKRQPRAIRKFRITPRDEEIIRVVARHRFITHRQIIALIRAVDPEASERNLADRLHLLFHDNYLSRPRIQQETYKAGSGSRPMAVILGNKAIPLLVEKYGFRKSSADWTSKARTASHITIEHALEVTDFMVALALACSRHGALQVVYFDEISHQFMPPETRESPQPDRWPVSVRPSNRWHGKQQGTFFITPDQIFAVRNLQVPEERSLKFYFFEADRSTMPVTRPSLYTSSLLRKLVLYGFTHLDGLHRQFLGLSHFRVLTVVPTRQRISTILAAHQEHTARLVHPAMCLFTDRRGLFNTEDFFAYPWVDAAGERHSLLD